MKSRNRRNDHLIQSDYDIHFEQIRYSKLAIEVNSEQNSGKKEALLRNGGMKECQNYLEENANK